MEIGGQLYDLEVVDTAGLDEYSFIPPDYCGDKYDGYVFVYAINNQESFNIVKVIKGKFLIYEFFEGIDKCWNFGDGTTRHLWGPD